MVPRKLIEERTCMKCEHYGEEWDGDYGTIFCGSTCAVHPKYQHLPSFPFKKKMPCFQINFWLSRFADLFDGEANESPEPYECRGLHYFKLADADGNLPPELERQFQIELAEHKNKYKDMYEVIEELRGEP